MNEEIYAPSGLLFQWHITNRCNLRCAHCYQDTYKGDELTFDQLIGILNQYKDILKYWRDMGKRVRGNITVTGGEPFVRKDFMDLLQVFHEDKKEYSFAILTNGYFINEDIANRLSKLQPRFVQVSIEGSEKTHESIRGKGSYQKAISGLKALKKAKIRSFISFTAHKENYLEFPEAVKLGRKLKVDRVWSDRLVPQGNGAEKLLLTKEETNEFMELMYKERMKAKQAWFNKTEVSMHRALQFLKAGGRPYHCHAGDKLITIMPNGDLYPCRRMPITVGNVLNTPLKDLYYQSEVFKELREKSFDNEGCEKCFYSKVCKGGLRCLTYATTGSLFKKDPGCFYNQEKANSLKHYSQVNH